MSSRATIRMGDLQRPSPTPETTSSATVARAFDAAVQELGRRLDELSRDRARMEAILAEHGRGRARRRRAGTPAAVNDAARRHAARRRDALEPLAIPRSSATPASSSSSRAALGGEAPDGTRAVGDARRQPHAGRPRRAGRRGRPRRGAGAARHHRAAPRRPDPPRLRRQRLTRAADAADRDQGLRRGAARRRRRPTRRGEFLDIIHRHATRMERLVRDLLRLARLDAGQESVERVPCDSRRCSRHRRPISTR